MTDDELLEKVKAGLGITGTYQDATLNLYIADVKYYLTDAGVAADIVNSELSVGAIIRGVADLWNYGSGAGKFSEYFYQRAIQLTHTKGITPDPGPEPEPMPESSEIIIPGSEYCNSKVFMITEGLFNITLDATFTTSENWLKNMYYEIGSIADERFYPAAERILVGEMIANDIEADQQNFFKVTTDGKIFVCTDIFVPANSKVRCILSVVYA